MRTKLAQVSVLVVEDHDFQRQVAIRLLQQMGVGSVMDAPDGRSGMIGESRAPLATTLRFAA